MLFEYLYYQPPFDGEPLRLELLRRLNEIPNAYISADKITKRPTFHLRLLNRDAAMERFIGTLDWVTEEIKRS